MLNHDDLMANFPSERAEDIFCAALEIKSEEERMAFIEEACAGDPGLHTAVQKMLASQDEAVEMFQTISPTSVSVVELTQTVIEDTGMNGPEVSPLPDDGEVGKQIGHYTLLKRIGEGGGGSVYLAEQVKPVRRQVALKIIKRGMDTKSVIARFEAERQTLAMMEHPNIAHVLNAGETDDGRPFFVMELVHGTEVTTYCNEHDLDISRRLHLFIQICHAIQHAHQKGIIHRDIKPSNIIITERDGVPDPMVIDFGIAKATGGELLGDHTAYTACEQIIGTPAYMSPEQADLAEQDIDVRSDIYSLGVLLYELLTSKTPFDQKKLIRSGLEAMRRTIRECEPSRPSARLARLPAEDQAKISKSRGLHPSRLRALLEGDLDWIIMKALEKDRDRRYGSADGLAADIQRYLNHEPVIARPPSRCYRLRKLVRRNKVVFAAGGVTLAVLLMSSTVSTWLLIKARIAEQQKGVLQEEAEVLRSSVEDQHKLAQASALVQKGEKEQADVILDGIQHPQATLENSLMYRNVGDWHALNGRWEKAKARFDVLTRINEFEGPESTRDDVRLAALLVEQGYLAEYRRFQEIMITRYAGSDNPRVAQRILQNSLLAPADDELMLALDQYARVTERSIREGRTKENDPLRGWQAYAMALFNYRRGDFEQTLYWCEQANRHNSGLPTRNYSVRLIQSCAFFRLRREVEAQVLLERTRAGIQALFSAEPSKSKVWQGFWFDQACVRIHLHEAEAMIEKTP